jgi:hypothetical protein
LGLEFRPDRRPPLFELFDANAGLFQFPSQNDVLDFFAEKLWAAFYKESYVKGEIDTFALYYYGGEE